MKTLWLKHDYQKSAAQLEGEFPDRSHADKILDADTEVRAPNGKIIAMLVCDAIPRKLNRRAFKLLKKVNGFPNKRIKALGTKSLPDCVGRDGKLSRFWGVNRRVRDASRARDGILGWNGPGRETALTVKRRQMLLGNKNLIKHVDALYQKHLPTFYAKQQAVIAKFSNCRLFGTCFSTIYVAKNFRTAYHRDSGNLPGVMTSLIPMGKFKGGELVLPRYRIAFALKRGDLLFFNPQELHGNLPIKGQRVSAAFYCGGWVSEPA